MGAFSKQMNRLRRSESGNALMLFAAGLPALVGSAGFATDLAQWYLWKRELQYAVDQAALAGAYAKANSNTAVQATYLTRATQEYNANVDKVASFDAAAGPTVTLEQYGGSATTNSVKVVASATKTLPFSNYFMDGGTTVEASAQATYTMGVNFTACMLALNPSDSAAFELGNSVSGSSGCGVGALSNNGRSAIKETGDNNIPLGTIVAGGDVDSTYSNNGTIYKNTQGLSNPYSSLSAPSSTGATAQAYPTSCPVATPETTTYAADGRRWTHYTYKYYKGSNRNNWSQVTYSSSSTGYIANNWSPAPNADYSNGVWSPTSGGSYTNGVAFTGKSVTSTTVSGLQPETTAAEGTAVYLSGNGNNQYWRVPFSSTRDVITNIVTTTTPATDGIVHLSPGTYSSIAITCKTDFAPGVYWISGNLDFGQNLAVTGTGVMFVMTGSSGAVTVNSNSNVRMSGITASQLTTSYGYSEADAAKMAGMLLWDPNSTASMTFNGNSGLFMSGVMYMPRREVTFNGSSSLDASNCLMIAANKIRITGNFSMSNFCVTTGGSAMSIGGTATSVKLVA